MQIRFSASSSFKSFILIHLNLEGKKSKKRKHPSFHQARNVILKILNSAKKRIIRNLHTALLWHRVWIHKIRLCRLWPSFHQSGHGNGGKLQHWEGCILTKVTCLRREQPCPVVDNVGRLPRDTGRAASHRRGSGWFTGSSRQKRTVCWGGWHSFLPLVSKVHLDLADKVAIRTGCLLDKGVGKKN